MKITKLPNGGDLYHYPYGSKYWTLNNKTHREDGPAIEYANGDKSWYFNGNYFPCKTQAEFERLLRLKSFW
jgi:hypothetical protein